MNNRFGVSLGSYFATFTNMIYKLDVLCLAIRYLPRSGLNSKITNRKSRFAIHLASTIMAAQKADSKD